MSSLLSDLDELVLKCRDKKAMGYIKEAVACYKSGANRSAIVSTWGAVTFDYIDKLKDLSLSGDREAALQLEVFEKALKSGDITSSLMFERKILSVARDKLELISHVELTDLQRLQEDRNRCAHPSMTSDGEIFNPSSELARMHIRTAIEHFLQHPPAQGKYALELLLKDVNSEYFPTNTDDAVVALQNSPLQKARVTLIRSFIIVLLKDALHANKSIKEKNRIYSALRAVKEIYRSVYDEVLFETLSSQIKKLDDDSLAKVFSVLSKMSESWDFLDKDIKQKLINFVRNLPSNHLHWLDFLIKHTGISEAAKARVKTMTREELNSLFFVDLPEEIAERMVFLYVSSNSFEQANNFASTIIDHAMDFSKTQVKRLIKACRENYDVKGSFEVGKVINALKQNRSVTDDEMNTWLKA